MDIFAVRAGERIRKYRKKKGWTQEKASEKAGISLTYWRMIERGNSVPSLYTFIDIITCLEVSADEILFGDVSVEKMLPDDVSEEMRGKIEKIIDILVN